MQEEMYKYARRKVLKHASLLHQDCKKNSTRIFLTYPFYTFSTNNKNQERSVIPKITITFGITIPNFIVIFGIRANYFTKTFLTLPSDILIMAMPFWVLPIFTPLTLKRAASVASFEDISMLAMPEAGS